MTGLMMEIMIDMIEMETHDIHVTANGSVPSVPTSLTSSPFGPLASTCTST